MGQMEAVLWRVGGVDLYDALVVSNSWGMYHSNQDFLSDSTGRYSDNPLHPFHLQLHSMAQNGIDVVFAAGNCGSACPAQLCLNNTTHSIMGASAHPKVLSVGGVDTQDNWVGYSSEGPSIPGMDDEKPDLMAYTHFDGSQAPTPYADMGTSAACPVAAGCIAALRTKFPPGALSPDDLRTTLEVTARKPAGEGWDPKYGNGIIDPIASGQALGVIT